MPKRGVAYTFNRALLSTAAPGEFQTNPTIAAGDFVVYLDNVAQGNMDNIPVVDPAAGILVKFTLSAAEMNGSRVDIIGIDQTNPAEWGPMHESILVTDAEDIADVILIRDWTATVAALAAALPAYCLLNAVRFLRNGWALVAGTPPVLHVKDETGTDAWTRNATTDAAADPITGLN